MQDSSKKGKRPLLWQQVFIVAITLTAVAVVILLGRQTYRETREMAAEQFNQQQLILARSAAAGIEAYYKELGEALASLAQLPNIQQMAPECLTCVQHTYWGFPPRTSIRLLDSDGVLRFIYPFDGWRGELIGRDYSGETYFQEASETGRISVSGLITNGQGETRIRIAVPVFLTHKTESVTVGDETGIIVTPIDLDEPEAGRFQGVLVGSLDPHIIAQGFISPIVSGKTGYAWLLNEEGVFLVHHEEGFTGRNGFEVRAERNPDVSYAAIEQIQHRMMAGEEGVGRYVSGWHRGERGEIEKLVAYMPVHINGNTWSVAVCAPVSEVEAIVQVTKRAEQYTLAFVTLALMAGGLCLFITSYRWSRSLEQEVARRTRELRESITERKRAEGRLRLLSSAVEQSSEGVAVADLEGNLLFVNNAFATMHGYALEELVGEHLSIFHTSEQMPSVEAANRQMQETGEFSGEVWHARRDGAAFPTLMHNSLLRDEAGNPIAMIGTLRDITERKRAAEAVRETTQLLETILDHTHMLVAYMDPQFNFVRVNRVYAEADEREPSFFPGKNHFDLYPNAENEAIFRRVIETGEPYFADAKPFEYTEHPERGVSYWDWSLVPIKNHEGAVTGLVLTLANVTERVRAEEALRESEDKYRATFESTGTATVIIEEDTTISLANTEFARLCGYSREEVGGRKSWTEFVVKDDLERMGEYHRLRRTAEDAAPRNYEFRFIDRGGNVRDIFLTIAMIPGTKKSVASLLDITERKRAEEALHRSLERISRGQRLLLALSQAAQAVQRARTPDEVYRTVADEVARLGYQAVIFTLTADRAHLSITHLTYRPGMVRVAEKLTVLSAQGYRFPLAPGGFFERIIAAGETTFVERTTEPVAEALPGPLHPLASRLVALLGMEQGILAPLTVGGETQGLLAVVGADLTEADVPAITAFAAQAATAIESARLFEEVRAGREQLRDLTGYLQTAREEERAYIAREIHDEFGQALTALKMDLAWLTKRLLADRPRLAEKASAMSDLIDTTIQTVRRVATELRPGLLDDLGLAAAIEWQAQEWAERTEINCELYLGDEDIILERDLATAIFRIFQETLTNVARHAQATEVRVELEDSPGELVLIIRDNGRGIAPGQVSDPRSLGLIGMRERAHSWGGDVTFQSVPGQGTTVTVRVPRPDESG